MAMLTVTLLLGAAAFAVADPDAPASQHFQSPECTGDCSFASGMDETSLLQAKSAVEPGTERAGGNRHPTDNSRVRRRPTSALEETLVQDRLRSFTSLTSNEVKPKAKSSRLHKKRGAALNSMSLKEFTEVMGKTAAQGHVGVNGICSPRCELSAETAPFGFPGRDGVATEGGWHTTCRVREDCGGCPHCKFRHGCARSACEGVAEEPEGYKYGDEIDENSGDWEEACTTMTSQCGACPECLEFEEDMNAKGLLNHGLQRT